jgi:type II secretory pathway predicted ATPase ExeA
MTTFSTLQPWVAHFGFTRTPFTKTIPVDALHSRDGHAEAVARIQHTITEAGLCLLVGEVGVGKTAAVRAATARLDPTRHLTIYVPNPSFGTRGLYSTIVAHLGHRPSHFKADLVHQTQTLLAAEWAERRRRVIVIIDEAHLLDPAQLEELRLLTNQDMDSQSPFAGILVGQPMLARQLRMGTYAALDQRIGTRYTLKPLDLAEAVTYLRHHCEAAGRKDPLFADDAASRLHRASSGLPRALNNAAVAALIHAAHTGKVIVDDDSAKHAAAELTRDT